MKVEAITSVNRDVRDPAMPEELPSWTKMDTTTDNVVEVRFKLPFPASMKNKFDQTKVMGDAELTVHIPVGKFAIFTEQCAKSTSEQLGVKGGKRLLDAVAAEYYRGLILAQLTEKP